MCFKGRAQTLPDEMTMNASTRNPGSEKFDSTTVNQRQVASVAADGRVFDKDRLADIQQELATNQQHLPERIAATVKEDYQQLLKDFGIR
jgi:hypothetical protein